MNILVVDDSALSRRMIREDLEKGGYAVQEAASGEVALQMAADHPPDLITLDVTMATMSGYETCMLLRRRQESAYPDFKGKNLMPVIFVTARDSVEERERGFEVGGTEFITKPFSKGSLLRKVNELLRPPQLYRGIKVLVVDDSSVARMTLRQGLARNGCEIVEAENGNEGLRRAQEMTGNLDLIISDYMMPGLNGEEFVRQVRRVPGLEDIPFIMLSAVSDRSYVLDMFKAGATDYLVKPFIIEELLARISVHLHSRQLANELQKNIETLERLHHAKNQFLDITAHDLRSPLMSMTGFFDLLNNDSLSPRDREVFSVNFHSSASLLKTLIDDLTTVSRQLSLQEEPTLEPVGLRDIIEGCLASFQPVARLKSIELRMINLTNGAASIIQGESKSLIRVFNNLISNAIKFTPHHGEVTLTLAPGDDEGSRVAIQDNGVGMNLKDLPKLFDPMIRETKKGTAGEQGTGLGLSIVKELVERQGGRLAVETALGKGSTFTVEFQPSTLPRA